jgi:hypothetical protein
VGGHGVKSVLVRRIGSEEFFVVGEQKKKKKRSLKVPETHTELPESCSSSPVS